MATAPSFFCGWAAIVVWIRERTRCHIMKDPDSSLNIHATTVALNGRAVVILGPSGSGKSSLGLMLMAWGCDLVADDRTLVSRAGSRLIAQCPPTIRGLIEARGTGLLRAVPMPQASIVLAVDMNPVRPQRLPSLSDWQALGVNLPLLHNSGASHFPAAILQYLKVAQGD
jgi:HPr kinase/phosphorylase